MEGDSHMTTATAPTQADRGRSAQQQAGDGHTRPAGGEDFQRWASLLGGSALALFGLSRGSLGGLGLALLGGGLAYRGATQGPGLFSGPRTRRASSGGICVERTASILRSPEELYGFWRHFENLPRFMHYLESVQTTGGNRSHWVAKGPLDARIEWDAEITDDRPNERIGWRSLPGSGVDTEGTVHFMPAPANRGTIVKVVMHYDPPGGKVGAAVAWLFGRSGRQEVQEDLRRFKRLMETGEVPTTRGQPSGRGRDPWEQTGSMILQHRFATGLGWFSIGLGLTELLAPEAVARLVGVHDHHALIRSLGAREIASGIGILTQSRPTGWLWGRVAGDAMDLSLLGAALRSPNAQWGKALAVTAATFGVTALDLLASLQHSCSPDGTSVLSQQRAPGAGTTVAAQQTSGTGELRHPTGQGGNA
jgi:uncharacterized membrane protein